MAELATFYGRDSTVGQVLRRMRCSGACGGRVGAAWLVTGPILSVRVRPRRVALLGPEASKCQPLAAVFGLGQRRGTRYFDQRQGSRVSIWRIGWSAMRLRTSAR